MFLEILKERGSRRGWLNALPRTSMIQDKRIAVVMPAYNAEKTLEATVRDLPSAVDIKILVDDSSTDGTAHLAEKLGLQVFVNDRNYGYGRNQQTCYREALAAGADIVVMRSWTKTCKPSFSAR